MKEIISYTVILLFPFTLNAQVPFDYQLVDGSGPTDIWGKTTGDLNGDGMPDLIAGGNGGGGLVWYENPGWTKHTISASGNYSTDHVATDINNDGQTDVVSLTESSLLWYANPGWTASTIENRALHDIEAADLNNDGLMDIVARDQAEFGHSGATIFLYLQISGGGWTKKSFTCPNGEGLLVTDINGDNLPDVVVNEAWFENTGNMDAWTQNTYTSAWTHDDAYIAYGDINNDGRKDLVLSPAELRGEFYHLSWFEHPVGHTGTWTEHIIENNIEAVVHFVGTADFNNDGWNDIATAEMEQGTDPDEVKILYNPGSGGSSWDQQVLATTGSHSMKIVDIDNDGDPDLYGANWQGNDVELWINNHVNVSLTAWERHVIDNSKPWRSVFIMAGDVNNDNLKDIITGGWWYQNPGTAGGTWSRNTIGSPLNNAAVVYDFNGDDSPDILGTEGQGSNDNSNFSWALNDGTGNFTINDNIDAGTGDFLQGIAVLREGTSYPFQVALSWHQEGTALQSLNVPQNTLSSQWTIGELSSVSLSEDLSAGDIDSDNDPDLLLGTTWLRDDGTSFSSHTLFSTTANPDRNELADMNNDGRPDAVVGYEAISTEGKLAWYEQPTTATDAWTEHVIANIIGPMSIDVADLDEDGDMDVVAGEHNLNNPSSARLFVFENANGQGTEWNQHLIYTGDEHHDGTQLTDIDNDGDLDIISIGWSHSRVLLYENKWKEPSPPQNTKPSLSGIESTALSYTAGDDPVNITNSVIITEPDEDNITMAQVTITSNYLGTEDTIIFQNSNGISGSFNNSTGSLTLSGSTSASNYQTALQNVKYFNQNTADPSTATRTVSFKVFDGELWSNTVSRDIFIVIPQVNNAPQLTNIEGESLSYTAGDNPVIITNQISVTEPDEDNITMAQVTITSNYLGDEDTLIFQNTSSITGNYNNSTGLLALSGNTSAANYQSALRSIKYQNLNTESPSTQIRIITFRVWDNDLESNISSRDISIKIPDVNNAPVISNLEKESLVYKENDGEKTLTDLIAIVDPDGDDIQKAEIRISENYIEGEDVLVFNNNTSITGSFNKTTGLLTLTGTTTATKYMVALRNVKYKNNLTEQLTEDSRKISFRVFDGKNWSNQPARTLLVQNVDDKPEIAGVPGDIINFHEGDDPLLIFPGIELTDPDNDTIETAKIFFASGYNGDEDTLIINNMTGITTAYNETGGMLSLSGNKTFSGYTELIKTLSYLNQNTENPDIATRKIAIVIQSHGTWSDTSFRTISVTRVNDPPSIKGIDNFPLQFKRGSNPVKVFPGIRIIDVDNKNLESATIKINNNYFSGEDTLVFENLQGLTMKHDRSNGVVTLTGSKATNIYQQALRDLMYFNSDTINPELLSREITVTASDGLLQSNMAKRSVQLIGDNYPPVVKNMEETPALISAAQKERILSDSIIVTDADNEIVQKGFIAISENYSSATDTLFIKDNSGVSSFFDKEKGVLHIEGPLSTTDITGIFKSVIYRYKTEISGTRENKQASFFVYDGTDTSNFLYREIIIEGKTGIHENAENKFHVYPNPAGNTIVMEWNSSTDEEILVRVTDINGQVIYDEKRSSHSGSNTVTLDVNAWPSGMYLFSLQFGKNMIAKNVIIVH